MSGRRPRGTREQAHADIKAAISRLATGVPSRTNGNLTATNLAAEVGMSRKQLYHYFDDAPSLAAAWQQLVDQRRSRRPENSEATSRRRVRHLEEEVQSWKAAAAVARAEAERQADINQSLRAENDRLRAANQARVARVVPLQPTELSPSDGPRAATQPT